jgi:hypothetical protein
MRRLLTGLPSAGPALLPLGDRGRRHCPLVWLPGWRCGQGWGGGEVVGDGTTELVDRRELDWW